MHSRLWVCIGPSSLVHRLPSSVVSIMMKSKPHSFDAFPLTDQAETVSRRVEKFAELMQSVWASRNDYEERMRKVRIILMYSNRLLQVIQS